MRIALILVEELRFLIKLMPNFTVFYTYNWQSYQYKRMLFSGHMTNKIVHNTLQFELEKKINIG
jgi:hypothetical protein